ncbi:MAG: serine/threonine protein kinase [Myxococcales bacterium]|nr:serine/threonine protein kinase [Myxococcales bacterium]
MGETMRGTLIAGRYELLERAGQGGMATVWRAKARGAANFTRTVAIKRIRRELAANSEFVAMFVEEARVGSELHHPHVVQIFDFGMDHEGRYFLVMEWVEGMDFGSYLRSYERAKIYAPWPLVVAICIEALRGLSAAHEREAGAVIHRDVNQQNVLLGYDGIAKLTDFGLSRAMDRARMTRPEIVKGKIAYLAPEITMGGSPSVQSDLFGIGIVLWEALAGRSLFDADTDVQVMINVRNCEVPPLWQVRRDLPGKLCEAVHTALAKDPEQRFATAHLMARALAKVLRGVDEDTHAKVIAKSVREARWRIAEQDG